MDAVFAMQLPVRARDEASVSVEHRQTDLVVAQDIPLRDDHHTPTAGRAA